jgi:ketosteroid isomerase-like protein
MIRSIIVLALAILTLPQKALAQSAVEKEIKVLEERVNAAYAANNLPEYFSYYTADLTQWLPDGRKTLDEYKKEWTEFISGGARIKGASISDLQIHVGAAGDTAVASYLLQVRTRPAKGEVTDEAFQETDVWFKRDGAWKIVHLHYSPAPKK